jgi:hypothetical protein
MGLRSKIKAKLSRVLNQFSGEHSDMAAETSVPYSRPGKPSDEPVVMAKLNRTKSS